MLDTSTHFYGLIGISREAIMQEAIKIGQRLGMEKKTPGFTGLNKACDAVIHRVSNLSKSNLKKIQNTSDVSLFLLGQCGLLDARLWNAIKDTLLFEDPTFAAFSKACASDIFNLTKEDAQELTRTPKIAARTIQQILCLIGLLTVSNKFQNFLQLGNQPKSVEQKVQIARLVDPKDLPAIPLDSALFEEVVLELLAHKQDYNSQWRRPTEVAKIISHMTAKEKRAILETWVQTVFECVSRDQIEELSQELLNAQEATVFQRRRLNSKPSTYQSISEELGVTGQTAQNLEKEALRKLGIAMSGAFPRI